MNLCKLAGDVSGVTVKNWGVPVGDLSLVVQNYDLSSEVLDPTGRLVLLES